MQRIADFNGVPLEFNEEDFKVTQTQEEKELGGKRNQKPLMFWLRQRKILINFIVMTLVWLGGSFNFYLIQFLLTTFD